MNKPINALHEAMASAVHRDLPDVEYLQKKWAKPPKTSAEFDDYVDVPVKRRPFGSELSVRMFPQLWSNTGCGYRDSVVGSGFTGAYTVIVSMNDVHAVYFGRGQLAYVLWCDNMKTKQKKYFEKCMREEAMPDVAHALNIFAGAIFAEPQETLDD
jgi:hypothetical protein